MIKFVLIVEYKQVNIYDKFGVSQSWTEGDIKNNIRGSKVINTFALICF